MHSSTETQSPKGVLLRLYVWLSGIVVAFLATYVTAVITAIVPAPKELLCKLSLGFCPSPKVLTFSSVDVDRIVDRDGVGQGIGSNQIGMLHNAVETNQRRPNMVKYRITTETSGTYSLRILYASNEERPVQVYVNDTEVAADALRSTTGGWDNQHRRWSPELKVRLQQGENTIMVRRADVFPHLSKFELVEVPKR